jgi:hypothetical protein
LWGDAQGGVGFDLFYEPGRCVSLSDIPTKRQRRGSTILELENLTPVYFDDSLVAAQPFRRIDTSMPIRPYRWQRENNKHGSASKNLCE